MIHKPTSLYLLACFSLVHTTQAQNVQAPSVEDTIIEQGDAIELWERLLEEVVRSDSFQKACQQDSHTSLPEWITFFDTHPLFSDKDKRYILSIVQKMPDDVSLQDVLANEPIPASVIEKILSQSVGNKKVEKDGAVTYEKQSVRDVLVEKAINTVKADRMEKLQEELEDLKESAEILNEIVAQDQAQQVDTLEVKVAQAKEKVKEAETYIEKAEENYWQNSYTYYGLIALVVFILLLLMFARFRRKGRKNR